MQGLYLIIALMFFSIGCYQMVTGIYIVAVHLLLVSLYFYVFSFEIPGKPFSKAVYLLLVVLLITDGLVNITFYKAHLFSGLVSFIFAYFSWKGYQRIKGGE